MINETHTEKQMPSDTKDQQRIQTSVMLDPDVRKKLRRVAADDETNMSDLINRALRSMFDLPRKNGSQSTLST